LTDGESARATQWIGSDEAGRILLALIRRAVPDADLMQYVWVLAAL